MTQADKRQAWLEARNAEMAAARAETARKTARQEAARIEAIREQARQETAAGHTLRFNALNVELVNGILYAMTRAGSLNGERLPGSGVRLGPVQGASVRVTRLAARVARAGVTAQMLFMASPSRKVPRASITVTMGRDVFNLPLEGNGRIRRAIAAAEKLNVIAAGL